MLCQGNKPERSRKRCLPLRQVEFEFLRRLLAREMAPGAPVPAEPFCLSSGSATMTRSAIALRRWSPIAQQLAIVFLKGGDSNFDSTKIYADFQHWSLSWQTVVIIAKQPGIVLHWSIGAWRSMV